MGRFINADVFVSTGQGIIGYNVYVYCNNNPVRYIDNGGKIPIDPSGDFAGWCGDFLGTNINAWLEENCGDPLRKVGSAFMDNLEGSVGIGQGLYVNVGLFDDFLSISGGVKHDLFVAKYDGNDISTGQTFYSGVEASIIGLFSAGDSVEQFREHNSTTWEKEDSDGYWEIVGGGAYFFAGFSFSLGLNTVGFINDLRE